MEGAPPFPTPPELGPGANASTLRLLRALLGPLYGRPGVTWSPPQPQRGPRGAPSPTRVPSERCPRLRRCFRGKALPAPLSLPPPRLRLQGALCPPGPSPRTSRCVRVGGGRGGDFGVPVPPFSACSRHRHVTERQHPAWKASFPRAPSGPLSPGRCEERSWDLWRLSRPFPPPPKLQICAPSRGKALWPPRIGAGDTDGTTAFSPSELRAALTRVFLSILCVPEGSPSPGRWDAGWRGRGRW